MSVLPLVLSVVLGSSCSSRFEHNLPAGTEVLTQAEAETICGSPVRLSYDTLRDAGPGCSYTTIADSARYSVSVNLQDIGQGQAATHEAVHRAGAAQYGTVEDIGGLGDGAFLATRERLDTSADRTYVLYARTGAIGFQLYAESLRTPPEVRELLIVQAQRIVRRLAVSDTAALRRQPN